VLQLRNGTHAENAVFTGLPGELTIDTTRSVPVVHDGVKRGGYPILPSSLIQNGNDFNIVTPTITTPVDGYNGFMGVVKTSAYLTTPVFEGLHTSSDWQISTEGNFFTVVTQTLADTVNLTQKTFFGLSSAVPVYIRVRHVSGEHLSSWSNVVKVVPVQRTITTPTISVESGPNSVPQTPLLTSSPYTTSNSTEPHNSSDWTVSDSTGRIIWSNLNDSVNLTSIMVPNGVLNANTNYTFAVIYNSNTLTSAPGTVFGQTVQVFPSVATPNVQVQGGPDAIPLVPMVTTSAFRSVGANVGHTSTDWQVLDAAGTVIWESLNNTLNLESISLPFGLLMLGTAYTFTALHNSGPLPSLRGGVSGVTLTPFIQTPTISVEGSPTSVPENPVLLGAAFSITGINETHLSTDWSVKNASGVVVWSSLMDMANLTTVRVPSGILSANTGYSFSVTYHSSSLTSQHGTLGARTVLNYPGIQQPNVQVQGGPSSVSMTPVISASTFAVVGSNETHVSTDWQILSSNGQAVWSSLGDTTNLNSITVPRGIVQVGGTYTFEARFNSQTLTSPYGSVQANTVNAYLNDITIQVEGGPLAVPEGPLLTSSAMTATGTTGPHVSSDWQVLNSTGQTVWSSVGDTANLTSIKLPRGVLAVNTQYTFTVQYHTSTLTSPTARVVATTKAQFALIATPTISVEGSATQLPENPTLTGSAYSVQSVVETHLSTDWVVIDSAGVPVWSSVGDTTRLTAITMPKGILKTNTSYTFSVKYRSATLTSGLGTAVWSTPVKFLYIMVGTWTTVAPLPFGFVGHGQSTLLDGNVLITGFSSLRGGGFLSTTNSCYLYNTVGNFWTAKANMPAPVMLHGQSTLLDGTVLVTGGGAATVTNAVYTYDPSANVWTTKGNMPTPRHTHGQSVLLNGDVLITGGSLNSTNANTGYSSSCFIYNPNTDTWTTVANVPFIILNHAQSTLMDGNVLITGGSSRYYTSNNIYSYNPSTDTWAPLSKLVAPLTYHKQSTLTNGNVLITGGFSPNNLIGTTGVGDFISIEYRVIYSGSTTTYIPTRTVNSYNMNNSRRVHGQSTLFDGTVFVTGGRDSSNNVLITCEILA